MTSLTSPSEVHFPNSLFDIKFKHREKEKRLETMAIRSLETEPDASYICMKLSPLDQIMLRGITRFLLCFVMPEKADKSRVIEMLQNGLSETVKQMPFLSGRVYEGRGARNEVEVLFRRGDNVKLRIRDDPMVSYAELREKKLPPSMLKDEVLSPMPNMPDPAKKWQPVIAAQATFVKGGVFLCLCFHHSVGDGVGFGTFVQLLGKNCSGVHDRRFDKVASDNMARENLFQNIDSTMIKRGHEYHEYKIQDPKKIAPLDPNCLEIPSCSARLFYFSASSLRKLKTDASPKDSNKWISTHDALGALAWRCISKARSNGNDPQATTKLVVPVNCRPHIKSHLPDLYIGNTSVCALPELRYSTAIKAGLDILASHIREGTKTINEAYILGLIEHIKKGKGDLNRIKPAMQSFLGNDITYVSWTDFPVYDVDFGPLLGKPEWFRCPYRALDGVVKVLPRRKGIRPGSEEEGLEVNIELNTDAMEKLLRDPLWNTFASEVMD